MSGPLEVRRIPPVPPDGDEHEAEGGREPEGPLQATLGEVLEAHHRRFVRRVEELKRKGELE